MNDSPIRAVEYSVLDQEYKRFGLLQLPEDLAITRLLKAKGDIDRDYKAPALSHISDLSLHTFASGLDKGLSHCLRWVCTDCPVGQGAQGPNWVHEDEQAIQLLGWGMRYAQLSTDHVVWSNGLIDATIDEVQKTIVFGPAKCMDVSYFERQANADLDWWQSEMVMGFPREAFVQLFNDWQRHTEWTANGLEFGPSFVRTHRRFVELRQWATHLLFPELPESCFLGSYHVGHLRTFFASLQTICDCIRTLEDEVDKRVSAENGMGTWTFQLPRPEFIDWLVDATGLAHEVLNSIVGDLTLDPRRFHCSIATTPFVLSRTNTLFLLPRMFAFLNPQRSFAAAMTNGSGRGAYERVANALERYHLDNI
jgi:hypothetical protein